MNPERWRQIDTIFKSAVELPSDERAAFIERACGGDEGLRAEVLSLVAHDRRGGTLGAPAVEEATRLLAAERAREQSLEGRTVGAYRIVSRLGAGGMGEVHLAVHERTGRKVALKLLPEHFAGDESRVRRFQQEARAVLRLNHPNIVTVYDIEQADGASVIASEYIEGETLRARLSRQTLAPAEALDVAAQVASALAAAHAEGVVHRDIKPENVMLRPDGFVKVLDFGLAKLSEEANPALSQAPTLSPFRTDPGVVMGTVAYMSPEQARARDVDARTDIWSLGVLLYEMLAGRAPFRGESPTDVLAAIVGKEPAPLARYLPAAPDALEWIVTKALTKDRDGRYQTAKELLTDLKRLKQQLEFEAAASRTGAAPTTEGQPAPAPSEASPTARSTDAERAQSQTGQPAARQTSSAEVIFGELKRHKRGALVAAALIACALAAGGFGLYKLMRGTTAPRAPFEKFGVRQLGDTGQAVDAALSPDGEFVAYVKDEAGRQSLWLRETSAISSVQIVPAVEGQRLRSPLFSRDGAFVYYLKAPARGHLATLYRIAKLGGGETKLIEGISLQDTRSNFALSPDGRQLAFIRLDQQVNRSLVVTNHDGSGERVLYRRDLPEFISGAAWSPDGKYIALVQGTFVGPKVFMAVNVADGRARQITGQTWKTVGGFAWAADSGALVVAAAQRGQAFQLWRLPFPEGEAQRITNDVSSYMNVSLSADSSVLATVQNNVVQNVWTAPPTTAGGGAASAAPAQLTFGAGRYDGAMGLAWTPDGRIVYHSLAGGGDDIWIMNGDGTGQRQLTSGAGTYIFPRVSPDGRYVLYNATDMDENPGVWRINLDGSNPKLLLRDGAIFSVSPDSRWVLTYKSEGKAIAIWRVPLEGGEAVRVRMPEGGQPTASYISPDGRLVAYNYRAAAPGAQWHIAVFPFEGGDAPVKVFEVAGSPIRQLRWTPDGRAVCHIETRQAVSNIMCLPLDGGPAFPVTDFESDFLDSFDFSPDGRRLALSRYNSSSGVVLINDRR